MGRIGLGLLLAVFASVAPAKEPDWAPYNAALKQHTTVGSIHGISAVLVDYQSLKTDDNFNQALNILESFPTSQLASKAERLSFYINAYNLYAIKMIVDHHPVASIRDIGGFLSPVWKKKIGRLDGKPVSLDQIEHKILRPMGEARIHFAIVCASMSCPDLRQSAFSAQNLSTALDQQTRAFLQNREKGLRLAGNRVKVSKIFDWFEQDFNDYGGVLGFISRYQDLPQNPKLAYLNYDWAVNDWQR